MDTSCLSPKKRFFSLLLTVFLMATVVLVGLSPISQQDESKSDYTELSWTSAFDNLHGRISREYAFTQWKGIEWDALYTEYRAVIEKAQRDSDFDAYYIGLRSYLHEIPDRHVSSSSIARINDKYVGGGFGIALAHLDDGSVIFTWVNQQSSAWEAGIRVGAELLYWDSATPKDALKAVSTVFTDISATKEDLDLKKQHYLVRGPVGKQVRVVFINEKERIPKEAVLTAVYDNGESFKKSYPDAVLSDRLREAILDIETPAPMPEAMVEKKILEDGIFYIRVWGEFDADLQRTGKAPSTLELFRHAVEEAVIEGAKGIVLDLRNNLGGLDQMAADMLGSFYSQKTFYEYQNVYNPTTGRLEIVMADEETSSQALYINPAKRCYAGRIIALINTRCVSSGEGIALGVYNLPNGDTLGFYGTNGSFGLTGSEAVMPGGITVRWPSGQSLDENKNIQLDSRNGVGGVSPSIRIPMSLENAVRVAKGEDVELEEAVAILKAE